SAFTHSSMVCRPDTMLEGAPSGALPCTGLTAPVLGQLRRRKYQRGAAGEQESYREVSNFHESLTRSPALVRQAAPHGRRVRDDRVTIDLAVADFHLLKSRRRESLARRAHHCRNHRTGEDIVAGRVEAIVVRR